MKRFYFPAIAFLMFAFSAANAEVNFDQDLKINNELSVAIAAANLDRISMRSVGFVDVEGELNGELLIVADIPISGRNDVTATPAAAIGNEQLACDIENTSPNTTDTHVFRCDIVGLALGVTNRVCVGYEELVGQNLQFEIPVFADNRCMDFPDLLN